MAAGTMRAGAVNISGAVWYLVVDLDTFILHVKEGPTDSFFDPYGSIANSILDRAGDDFWEWLPER
jgi:hypothetical protein